MGLLSHRIELFVAAALLVAAVSPRALAQDVDDATRAAARDLASEGSDLYQAESFEQAYDRFNRAYQLVHAPTVGIWAARSLVKLGRLVEASERFLELERLTLAENASPEHHKAKEDAAAERQALAPRIPSVRVLLEGAQPSEVFVTLNGELLQTPLVGEKRPVNPGKLAIKGTRGRDVVQAEVDLKEGETRDVKLVFASRSAPGPVPLAAAPVAP
ncbi:MAG TPA: tetratricopeptide repeat protein, partial [Polyangiaceae bacterium]